MKYLVQPIVCHSLNTPGTLANAGRNFAITAPHNGLALSIPSGQNKLQPQPWLAEASQTFRFIPVDGEWCVIEVQSSYKVLEAQGTENGSPLLEADRNNSNNQQFRVVEGDPGRTFLIECRNSNRVVDLMDYRQGAGGALYLYDRHGRLNQQWIFSEVKWDAEISDLSATVYAEPNYQGASQKLGVGSFDIDKLRIGNDTISSIKVPDGLRVTVFKHSHFQGEANVVDKDVSWLSDDNAASSILVEKVVKLYSRTNYNDPTPARIGVGRYRAEWLDWAFIGNDNLKSLRVPPGMMVLLFEHDNFKGRYVCVTEDMPTLPSPWGGIVSSLIVKQTGLYLPDNTLRYGGKVSLINVGTKGFLDPASGTLGNTTTISLGETQKFTLVRSGQTTLRSHVCYGDIVSLKTSDGKYVVAEKDGAANANRTAIGEWEKWEVIRSGDSQTRSFVSIKDIITLRSIAHQRYLVANTSGGVDANVTSISDKTRWSVASYKSGNAPPAELRTSACGADACAANVCPTELCGADACAAAACSAAAAVVSTCVAAATTIAACVVDVGGVAAGVFTACGAAVTGIGACGADLCGAAVCGAAACGTAACGAAGCGADACAIAANLATVCGANAGGIDACVADFCGANTCGVNLCPADACGADACGIDAVPVLPFI